VSARITQRTRTSGWQSSFSASSASTFSFRTDDPSLSTTLAPVLTVMLGFGNRSGLRAVSKRPVLPPLPPDTPRAENDSLDIAVADNATDLADAERSTSEVDGAESNAPDPQTENAELPPENNVPDTGSEGGAGRSRGEKRLRLVDPPSAAAESDTATPPASAEPEPAEPDAEPAKPAHPHRLEMTIDSLPHHDLTEPIPIYIDPLGDTVFTATMGNLDISATGNSIGEALVLLKEQIEFIYGDLSRRPKRSPDQTTMLQMLHTYIAPTGTKPAWL
jgi:hypothetical protein